MVQWVSQTCWWSSASSEKSLAKISCQVAMQPGSLDVCMLVMTLLNTIVRPTMQAR